MTLVNMSRTIELGRAVLSSPSTKLELWLTTLITISPAQDATNLQHLSDSETIDLLASGTVWVGRANGMHLSLDITFRREPLPINQLRHLADSVVNAPAWKQLGLLPSLPMDEDLRHGKLCINIGQLRGEATLSARNVTHAYVNALPGDATPPESVPAFLLHAIESAVVITETRSRTGATKSKQPKKRSGGIHEFPEDGIPFDNEGSEKSNDPFMEHSATLFTEDSVTPFHEDSVVPMSEDTVIPLSEDSDMLFYEDIRQPRAKVGSMSAQIPMASVGGRKRPRSSTSPNRTREDNSSLVPMATVKRQRPSTMTTMPVSPARTPILTKLAAIEMMVDATMRISVFNSLRGSSGSFKIKANTFSESLADIAPALWRPEYRSALSLRANLASTLSLSIGRVSLRATGTLRTKIRTLKGSVSHDIDEQLCSIATDELDVSSVSPSVATRIWVHGQRNLLAKPNPGAIQPFCVSAARHAGHGDVDELLDEQWGQLEEATIEFGLPLELSTTPSSKHEKLLGHQITATEGDRAEDEAADDDELLFDCT